MAVIIHEFEVVPERKPAEDETAGGAAAPAAPPLAPRDVELILLRQASRRARLRAH